MKHHLPPLDTLKAFEAAARHLSFSLAADELCISKGAVSYQIRKLEARLQCALFKRTTRQVYLTDAGQSLLHTTRRLFSDLQDTLHRLKDDQRQAAVTVAATTYVAARWLSTRIAAFNTRYPDITIHLQHSVNSDDFKLTNVDMAIRWGPCHRRQERSRLLEIPMALFPAISPALLKQSGISRHNLSARALLQSPLNQLPLLCEARQQDLWQEWCPPGLRLDNTRRVISDANVRVQAAIDGQGWVMADALMRAEIDNGLLVAPFTHQLQGYGYALLHAPGRISSEQSRALRDWLIDCAG